jgi:NAD(P)-dependent dehydrogenase (short-subunit alcohol dehydrogenase family)
VLGTDMAATAGARVEAELQADGLDFAFERCDLSSSEDVAALAQIAQERFDVLDVLYNNAGAMLGKPLTETTDEEWDAVMAVNLRGAFLTMRALVPLMGRRASIVNVASGLGLVGAPNMSAYCASKGGLVLLTKAAALELGPDIRVNVLCPGVIDTEMPRRLADSLPEEIGRTLLQDFAESHAVKRLGTPEEVVAVAVFLASDEASFLTGAAIPVDSGITAG